jgi:hypothetical protein
MRELLPGEARAGREGLPISHVVAGLPGSKDGTGIGDIVDPTTVDGWVREYLAGKSDGKGLGIAFRYGVRSEGRFPGQSFVEAEPTVRSEWSSERGRLPWESVRDAVWAGFDRARTRRV